MNDTTIDRPGSPEYVVSDTGPFAIVPEWVLDHEGLSDRAVRLYGLLARYADQTGLSWPRRALLADRLRTSVKSVDRALAELEAALVVEIEPRWDDGGQRSNYYRIRRICPYPSSPVSPPPGHRSPPGGDTRVAQNETQGTRPRERSSPPSAAGVVDDRSHPEYGWDRFWAAYPQRNGKKVGKAKTLQKWRALGYDSKAVAWRAVQNYARAVEAGLTIAKDPERFLSARYFEDWADTAGQADRREPARPEEATQRAQQAALDRRRLPKCPACDGTGWTPDVDPVVACPACEGHGVVTSSDPTKGAP